MAPERSSGPSGTSVGNRPASTAPVAAVDSDTLDAGSPFRRFWLSAHRGSITATAALGTVLGIAALSYWWTQAPLYNPAGSIDPWTYTALFVNFHRIYEHFSSTYYASRLPWVVPGRILYGVLPVGAAYWVLHGLAFCGGVTAVFVLVRRYLGVAAAAVGAVTLALTPLYWDAQYWDYIDGIALTYLAAGLCFGLPVARGRRRAASLAVAGLFFAAAVTTNVFVGLVALIYPIAYLSVQPACGMRRRLVPVCKDMVALLVGATSLLVALGFYARANGGPFLFFEPQIDFARSGAGGAFKVHGYEWLRTEPRLLVPVFLLAVAAPLLVLGRRLPPWRFAAGSAAGLAFLTSAIYGWEFFAGGAILEYTYYFSYFAISIALTMASVAALAVSLARSHWSAHVGVAVAATIAAVVALGLIYHNERPTYTGRSEARISLLIMVLAASLILGALVTRRTEVGRLAAVVAIGAVAFASHFAINSSYAIFTSGSTQPVNRSLYRAAIDNFRFVNSSTAHDVSYPAFWYSGAQPDFMSIQSMFYFGYTYLDLNMPRVTAEMRQRLALLKPHTIVMLCETRNCAGGPAALRRAGYPYTEKSARLISEGRIRLWTVLLRDTST